jgi:coxsackievirus/adenovirus receptor
MHYKCFSHFIGTRSVAVFPPVCLEAGKQYRIRLEFKRYESEVETPTASVLVDSVSSCCHATDFTIFQM